MLEWTFGIVCPVNIFWGSATAAIIAREVQREVSRHSAVKEDTLDEA